MGKEEPLAEGEIALPVAYWRRVSLLVLLGMAAVLLLGQLSLVDNGMRQRRHASAVFEPVQSKALTDANLVDGISELALRERLIRVKWDHAILAVDLSEKEPDAVWTDAAELIKFAFADKMNVRQVLIRIFNGKNNDRMLLMAAETGRSDWSDGDLAALLSGNPGSEPGTSGKIRITVTPSGQRWKLNFAK